MQGSNNFFISGLPRSRTAWLANLFTTDRTFCYHDALSFNSLLSMVQRFAEHKEEKVGDSDSALILHMSPLMRFFPNAAWVFVRRPLEEASSSFWRTYGPKYPNGPTSPRECDLRFEVLEEQLGQAESMVANKMIVTFDRLSDERTIRRMWGFLLGDVPFNRERYLMLETMQINIIPSKVRLNLCHSQ